MERSANYGVVAIAVAILTVAMILFTIWIARIQFVDNHDLYDIIFSGPADGVAKGSKVEFNGLVVGEVAETTIDPDHGGRASARIRIADGTPVRMSSRAQLAPQFLTGEVIVQISTGSPNDGLLKDAYASNVVPVLPDQRSGLSELLEAPGAALTQTLEALKLINTALSDENIADFSLRLRAGEAATADLTTRRSVLVNLQASLTRANAAIADYETLGREVRVRLDTEARPTLARLNESTARTRATLQNLNGTFQGLEGTSERIQTETLPDLNAGIATIQSATDALQNLVDRARTSGGGRVDPDDSRPLPVGP